MGRGHFAHRTAIVGKDKAEILQQIEKADKRAIPEDKGKICFLFTGQGSQYPGMAKGLYENSLVFRLHFDECDTVLRKGESKLDLSYFIRNILITLFLM